MKLLLVRRSLSSISCAQDLPVQVAPLSDQARTSFRSICDPAGQLTPGVDHLLVIGTIFLHARLSY